MQTREFLTTKPFHDTVMVSQKSRISDYSVASTNSIFSQIPTHYLLFEVEDNGIGVPPELMDTLFRPFKQTQRLTGGTGLGLYSLAKRIEAIHGEYGVRGRRDGQKGSLFWFTVPYRPDEVSSVEAQAAMMAARSDTGSQQQSMSHIPHLMASLNIGVHPAIGGIAMELGDALKRAAHYQPHYRGLTSPSSIPDISTISAIGKREELIIDKVTMVDIKIPEVCPDKLPQVQLTVFTARQSLMLSRRLTILLLFHLQQPSIQSLHCISCWWMMRLPY
jgi:hypothetical protein